MGNIVLLDDLTINQIAAGEVIERPASVVKEVVENSIDAGADNISIEIKNGGISYIRITDNGKGIQYDDLEIAFERHATSKIRKAEDLETVKSMGFRGEALASIAAIARVELVSKTEDSDIGHKIVVEGGKILSKEEIGCPKGTTITIQNLFFNTPVRYKFLKKDFTESGYIEDCITRIALVNPNIAIKFINTGKTVIQTSGNGEIKDIIYGIYGKDIAENIINVEYYYEDMAIKGVIGKPSIARSNRSNQLFFVNKRYVKDKTLTSAAEQGFKGMLTIGKYGFLVLNIEIDPHKLDVNVHPTKMEVRFQEENKIFKLVYHAIKEALLKGNILGQNNTIPNEELFKKNYISELEKIDTNSEKNGVNENTNTYKQNKQEFENINSYEQNKREFESTNSYKQNKQEFENIIVKEDGGIELKQVPKKEGNTNLQRLIKELDANLEKMNMKKSMINPKLEGIDDSQFYDEKSTKVERNSNYRANSEIIGNGIEEENRFNSLNNVREEENNFNSLNNVGEKENHFSSLDNIVEESNQQKTNTGNSEQTNVNKNTANSENSNDNKNNPSLEGTSKSDNCDDNLVETNNSEKYDNNFTEPNNSDKRDNNFEEPNNSENPNDNFEEMYEKMFGTNISARKVQEKKEGYSLDDINTKTVENISLFNNTSIFNKPVYKFIGIVFDTYIIIEYEKEMYIIDQHAAHERILYEKVKKNYYSDTDKDSQLMLLPDIINLTHREMGIAKDNMQLFRKAGFDLEEFGENTIKLNGVPNVCIDLDTRELFLETLDEINTVARTAKQEIEEKFIATVACKAAVKANMALTPQEVDNLMQQLLVLPNPFTCPHGRPTAIRMSKIDIEKKFSRR